MNHKYKFKVESVGINPHYESGDFYIVNYLLATMANTYTSYRLAAFHLQEEDKSWIVSNIFVEYFAKPLQWTNEIEVSVGFRNTKGLRVLCDLEMTRKGEKIAQATMQWTVIDEIKRRPVAYPAVEEKIALSENLPYDGFNFPKMLPIEALIAAEQKVTYSTIDFNHHLNAYQYFRFAYDAMPAEFIDNHYPVKFQAKFEREIMLGETAKMAHNIDDLHSEHIIIKSNDEGESASFRLSVDWAKRGDEKIAL